MTKYTEIVQKDIEGLKLSDAQYGGSWLKRGGVGAFMMLARKWDRIEQKVKSHEDWNLIKVIQSDTRAEGIIDDIRDLRRYLMLVEAYFKGGDAYIEYLDPSEPEEIVETVYFADLLLIWTYLEQECCKQGWDIFKNNSYDIKYLRMLLVQLEANFNDIGINPTHRDNA